MRNDAFNLFRSDTRQEKTKRKTNGEKSGERQQTHRANRSGTHPRSLVSLGSSQTDRVISTGRLNTAIIRLRVHNNILIRIYIYIYMFVYNNITIM